MDRDLVIAQINHNPPSLTIISLISVTGMRILIRLVAVADLWHLHRSPTPIMTDLNCFYVQHVLLFQLAPHRS